MNVFTVLASGLIAKNTRITDALTADYLTPIFGEVNHRLLRLTIYLTFSCLVTYFIRKESENDIEVFKKIDQGLKIESHNSHTHFFREFLYKFEGVGAITIWVCRIFPLLVFGFRIFDTFANYLSEAVALPPPAQVLMVVLGIALWSSWLHKIRIMPIKALIRKKTELFGN